MPFTRTNVTIDQLIPIFDVQGQMMKSFSHVVIKTPILFDKFKTIVMLYPTGQESKWTSHRGVNHWVENKEQQSMI